MPKKIVFVALDKEKDRVDLALVLLKYIAEGLRVERLRETIDKRPLQPALAKHMDVGRRHHLHPFEARCRGIGADEIGEDGREIERIRRTSEAMAKRWRRKRHMMSCRGLA